MSLQGCKREDNNQKNGDFTDEMVLFQVFQRSEKS